MNIWKWRIKKNRETGRWEIYRVHPIYGEVLRATTFTWHGAMQRIEVLEGVGPLWRTPGL